MSRLPAVSPPFVLFGPDHLGAVSATALLALVLLRSVRRHSQIGRAVRFSLAGCIVALAAVEVAKAVRGGWATPANLLPLHLCDMAMFLAVYALLSLDRRAAELLYFWAGAGTALAMATPELGFGFPRWEYFVFFGLHGLVLASALTLVFGYGLHPRAGAPARAFLATAIYAAVVGAVNANWGTNFMYLCAKPETATLLDVLGPWPVYLLAGAAIAFVAFHLLFLPFRRRS